MIGSSRFYPFDIAHIREKGIVGDQVSFSSRLLAFATNNNVVVWGSVSLTHQLKICVP